MLEPPLLVFCFLMSCNALLCFSVLRTKRNSRKVTSGYVFVDDPTPSGYGKKIMALLFSFALALVALAHIALFFHGNMQLGLQALALTGLSWFYVGLQ